MTDATSTNARMCWGQRIPLRDGVHLNAILYLPKELPTPAPAIVTLTPYIAQSYHDRGLAFAARGFPFLIVDVRGRGDSEGQFRPNLQEANDGYDVVEWLARRSYCNGKVAMWGGSYAGYAQWATAKELPPHLAAIAPVAAPFMGVDFPMRNNIPETYAMQWLTQVEGRASQSKVFGEEPAYWRASFRDAQAAGVPFEQLDRFLGMPSPTFQEWVAHPSRDAYWDAYNPTVAQYGRIEIPVLSITGVYDGDQLGTLAHYRQHMSNASEPARAEHCLVIGPGDHAGTRTPAAKFAGITVGSESLVDLQQLHVDWYDWVLRGGVKPAFLQKRVAYYVMVADRWQYADSLEEITERVQPLYLQARDRSPPGFNPTDVFCSGELGREHRSGSTPHEYRYDPADLSYAGVEATVDPESLVDQRMIHALRGKLLVYHSAPFEQELEIGGCFRLSLWLAIDQPDTDFRASIFEIDSGGRGVLLSEDWIRARYRTSLREQRPVSTGEPLQYEFKHFPFVSRLIARGCRLRLVIRAMSSIHSQKNYNSGGVVASESFADARPVTVRLFHDESHPSVLHVPVGRSALSET
ncbi:CocE/NonD family hydrolase [Steroidobacter sp.]|uniref:CocE/NonD family hydrolase n=1 Tax=Steroidobacter sp. TaxID=1978227 RepID=UPI001A4CE748|nr:CocE/NonD family hydrolase [Steroidobacter sp.]MBL8265259.1 CocE/NonD family hydrolase [Steroidobacter sp.]